MVSLFALVLFTAPVQSPKILGRVWAIDPCTIDGVPYAQHQMPREVPTGLGGKPVETFGGSARLKLENASGSQIGSIVLVGRTKIDFKKNSLLFPLGFTLNRGTIDCESDPDDCQISVNAGSCTVTTTGTHFLLECIPDRKRDDPIYNVVHVEVYDGTVSVTPYQSQPVSVTANAKGTVGPRTGGGIGFNSGNLSSKEKQDHKGGPAHIR